MPPRTILLVDDEPDVREPLRDALEADGYPVQEAGTGRAALAACRRGGIALVVTDVVMLDMDGLELLRALRREHAAVPIIVNTGTRCFPRRTSWTWPTHSARGTCSSSRRRSPGS
jgi:CheY-like chemotaxis protein